MQTVVSAVIVRRGRVLLTQRRPDKDFPLAWECPGGKVEEGETFRQALARELAEEIGVRVEPIEEGMVWRGEVDLGRTGPKMICFYRVELSSESSEPKPLEGQGIGWFRVQEMGTLDLAPANRLAFDRIGFAILSFKLREEEGWL